MEPRVIDGGRHRIAGGGSGARYGLIGLGIFVVILLAGGNWAASLLIEYSWWKESDRCARGSISTCTRRCPSRQP